MYWFSTVPALFNQVGLPGAVEAHESVGGVPESVWKKVQTVKQGGGGLDELKGKVRTLIHVFSSECEEVL